MFPIRRAALRLLSSPSTRFVVRSRNVSSLTQSSFLVQKQTSSVLFQKRWASDEAKKDDLPISQLQPTPQEEVEHSIQQEHTSQTIESSTEPPADATTSSAEGVTDANTPSINSAQDHDSPMESVQDEASGYRGRSPRTSDSKVDGRNTPKPTIYIGNLFFDVTEEDLTKELSRFGSIEKVKLIRDARGLSKGFGYVTFNSIKEASNAVSGLHQQLFEGRRLNVAYASTNAPTVVAKKSFEKPLNPPTKTLFIGNMSWEMTDRDLNNLFKGIKNVVDVRVAIDRRTGQPRGFAHADFTDTKSAMEGFKVLETKESYGRKLRLDYSYGPSSAPRNEAKDRDEL